MTRPASSAQISCKECVCTIPRRDPDTLPKKAAEPCIAQGSCRPSFATAWPLARLDRSTFGNSVLLSTTVISNLRESSVSLKYGLNAALQKFLYCGCIDANIYHMSERLSIIVVEPDHERALMIVDSLREAGDNDIHVIAEVSGLSRRISERHPDVVIVDVTNPTRDMIEELTLATSPLERPVAMFVDQSDDGLTKAAIEAGVSAYVVDDLRPDRLRPVIAAAIARFNVFRRMRDELSETKRALEERKVIDRAKGLLMKARGIEEDAAYAILRKAAMDQGKRISEVASAIVTAAELLS